MFGEWVERGESEIQEFKIRTSASCRRAAAETLCAMLNTRGGRVIFGVTKEGDLQGQETSDKTIEDVVAELSRIDPPAALEVDRVPLDGNAEAIVVAVGQEPSPPTLVPGHRLPPSRQQHHRADA